MKEMIKSKLTFVDRSNGNVELYDLDLEKFDFENCLKWINPEWLEDEEEKEDMMRLMEVDEDGVIVMDWDDIIYKFELI